MNEQYVNIILKDSIVIFGLVELDSFRIINPVESIQLQFISLRFDMKDIPFTSDIMSVESARDQLQPSLHFTHEADTCRIFSRPLP